MIVDGGADSPTVNVALADALMAEGVDHVFGLMGEDTAKLIVEICKRGVRYMGVRHEATAVGMAHGYGRRSGQFGVAVISRGPGLTNSATALVAAAKAGASTVVITGDSALPTPGLPSGKYVDQVALLKSLGVPCATIDSPQSAKAVLDDAIRFARKGATVVVNVNGSVFDAPAGTEEAPDRFPAALTPAPDPEAVSMVADLLCESWAIRNPVVLAGRGAVRAGARSELINLAETSGALLATTLMARSFFRSIPFDLGIAGTYSTGPAIQLLGNADLILVFGASLNPWTTLRGELFPNARIIRFDREPAPHPSANVDLHITSDARQGAQALLDALDARNHKSVGYRRPEIAEILADSRPAPIGDSSSQPLDPRTLMSALDAILPEDRVVVVDNGHHATFSTQYLGIDEPDSYIAPIEYHSIGVATSIALGSAVASPDKLTVLCVGDLGFLMSVSDLEPAARYELPLLVLVSNDQALGSERHYLTLLGLPDDAARAETPSLAAVAEGFGCEGLTVSRLEDLQGLGDRVLKLRRPLVVDCQIDPDLRADWVDWFFSGH